MEKIDRLGSYRIDAELSQSSTTSVYRGYEESLKRPVLIKKLHPQMAREEDIRKRFAREAEACAKVQHENIVSIYAYYSDPELSMLVMEYVEGYSLGELVSRYGALDWRIGLSILRYVLKGLGYAHDKGVIHRDIKPDNILISNQGQVKLSDFGLATVEDAPNLTMQGTVVGTPAYMPPEQISGESVDQRSDLFSLGASFYEVLTGVSPFRADSFSETIKLVLNEQPQKPSIVVPEIPPEFDQIILRLLDKKPIKRYATAAHTLEDVRSLGSQHEVSFEREAIRLFLESEPGESVEDRIRRTERSTIIFKPKRRIPIWTYTLPIVAIISWLVYSNMSTQNEQVEMPATPGSSTGMSEFDTASSTVTRAIAEHEISEDESGEIDLTAGRIIEPVRQNRLEAGRQPDKVITLSGENEIKPSRSGEPQVSDPVDQLAGDEAIRAGQLLISSRPWASVSIDGKSYGETPLTDPINLSPGVHQVILDNDQLPAPVVETVIIDPGEETQLDVDLMEYFGRIRILSVKPWADIYIDGNHIGETPYAKPIIVTFEPHIVELRHKKFKTWRLSVELNKQNSDIEINAVLEAIETVNDGG